ncbi:MAG: YbhN family protein [Erysipelotrichaceae bacterium]
MSKLKNLFKNKFFNLFLIFGISAIVIFVTVKDNFDEVMATISKINFFYIVILLALSYLVQVVMAIILKLLTNINRPDYTFFNALSNVTIASLFHGITPSASGGQVIQTYIFRKQGIKIERSLSILLIDFILYQSALVLVSVVFLIVKFDYFLANHANLILLLLLGFIINSAIVMGLFLMSSSKKFYTFVSVKLLNLLVKFKVVKNKETTLIKLNESLNDFAKAWSNILHHKKAMVTVFSLNILRLLIYYSIPIFIFWLLGFELSWAIALQVLVLTSFTYIMNAMMPIPGASGTTEAVFISLMTPQFGYVGAVSASLIWRFTTYYFILFIGMIFFVQFKNYHNKEK